jgi:hypothetical protein
MNIFAVHPNPYIAASQLCDQHVCKMLGETAQMLSTALHRYDITAVVEASDFHPRYKRDLSQLCKPAYKHHPCTVWAGDDIENFAWLVTHGMALGYQYRLRYPRRKDGRLIDHSSYSRIIAACTLQAVFKVIPGSMRESYPQPASFPQCMPDEYKGEDPHEAYKRYYAGEKTFARYRYTTPPDWMPATSIQP